MCVCRPMCLCVCERERVAGGGGGGGAHAYIYVHIVQKLIYLHLFTELVCNDFSSFIRTNADGLCMTYNMCLVSYIL